MNAFHREEGRARWQNPEEILSDIGLQRDSTFIDVGCGDGFFTIPAAKIVGERGRVYGIDLNSEALSRLKLSAEQENLRNIDTKLAAAEDTTLCDHCSDIIFFGIVLHDFRDPAKVLRNALRMLKPSGKLADLDWKKEPMSLGPPLKIRLGEKDATRLLEDAGFKVETVKDIRPYSYLIIAKPDLRSAR